MEYRLCPSILSADFNRLGEQIKILEKEGVDEEVKSVKKKFKDRHFAAGCNRDVIRRGVERMGISLDELMEGVILGMRDAADALGLGMQA